MRKLMVPVACLLFLAVMFKLSLGNYHSGNSPNQKLVQGTAISNLNQAKGTAFEKPNSEFEVIQAP